MTTDPADARYAAGLARYLEVYGHDATTYPRGEFAFFDIMIEQLFGEIWTRPALDTARRRLLNMGVLAAQGRFETLRVQFERALAEGDLTSDQVREVAIHLIPYVGYASSGDLFAASEGAISDA